MHSFSCLLLLLKPNATEEGLAAVAILDLVGDLADHGGCIELIVFPDLIGEHNGQVGFPIDLGTQ